MWTKEWSDTMYTTSYFTSSMYLFNIIIICLLQKINNILNIVKFNNKCQVLNLTLLRFVYDRETSNKKKVLSDIDFPTRLNLNKYVKPRDKGEDRMRQYDDDDENVYKLSAVVCHCGPSAYG